MIQIAEKSNAHFCAEFKRAGDPVPEGADLLFDGSYLKTLFWPVSKECTLLLIGLGDKEPGIKERQEAAALAAKEMKEQKIYHFAMNIGVIADENMNAVSDLVQGILMGSYELPKQRKGKKEELSVELLGIPDSRIQEAENALKQGKVLGDAIVWARDMVNMPGNHFTPAIFAEEVADHMEDAGVEWEALDYDAIKQMGMGGLRAVGESSTHEPCMFIMRYRGDQKSNKVLGLIGKGVTCDTGGYCLKAAGTMMGIKGDMAGGAAVAGAIYALAKNQVPVNVTGLIPMCENRIAKDSLVPGDVISSYAGKTIEICNTDAEGRLILADAATYAVREEKVTHVLDIATLTGAVVNMLGFSTAGLVSDHPEFVKTFYKAIAKSGERYWRLPIFEEQQNMIKSQIADIKNMGGSCCGTITAALFIKAFTDNVPWIHLDIAGTAWVDPPLFAYQSVGATGAGITSLYFLAGEL